MFRRLMWLTGDAIVLLFLITIPVAIANGQYLKNT
jgi:hypothetical protein